VQNGITEKGDRPELRALTGLRIVAALWVMLLHLRAEIIVLLPGAAFVRPLLEGGDLGVDIFFTLSGFVLAYQYLDRLGPRLRAAGWGRFVQTRFARVYPIHFLMLQVAVLVAVVAAMRGTALTHELRTPLSYVENLFLVQAWFGQQISWNGVAWSVSAEWFAYLLFPLAAIGMHRLTRSWQLALGIAVPILFAGLVYAKDIPYLPDVDHEYALLRIAVAFTIGCFLYKLHRAVRVPRAVAAWLPIAAAALILIGTWVPDLNPAFELIPIAGLVFGLALGAGPLSGLLATRPLVWGGAVSYALYMIHGIAFGVARALVIPRLVTTSTPLRTIGLLALFAVCIAGAGVVHHLIEEPARRLLRPKPRSSTAVSGIEPRVSRASGT
jgi:peptidoglycan/LPS O-acetylase OafA/YrhL